MNMETAQAEELIEVVVRLPRKAVEQTLLSTSLSGEDRRGRRLGTARAVMAGRRRRAIHFRGVYFKDPSWDMILELYIAAREQRHVGVSRLCELIGGSTTTALRHVELLEALGYIERQSDPRDGRRLIVVTRARLLEAVDQWLDLQIAERQIQDQRAD